MHRPDRSDRSSGDFVRPLDDTRARRRQDRESGQAMVEFVLVLFPLLVLVGGVIQLGIGIANWHDLNRIANEGARFAATNEWPGCAASQQTCTANPLDCQPRPRPLLMGEAWTTSFAARRRTRVSRHHDAS